MLVLRAETVSPSYHRRGASGAVQPRMAARPTRVECFGMSSSDGARRRRAARLAAGLLVLAAGAPPPRRLTDQRGRTFAFAGPARRVVPIAIPLLWHYAFVDRGAAHVAGANAVAVAQLREGMAPRVFPGLAALNTAVTRGGTFTPNVEALLALRPDAVFQWADRGDALVDVLDRAGIPAVGVKNTNHESDVETWLRLAGVVAAREARADSLVRWMRRGNARFDALTAAIPARERPRVLVLTEFSRTVTANGPGSYAVTAVERAGGRSVATADGPVTVEQVLAWDPEVILLTAFEVRTPADLMADPVWRHTTAARARRVYKLPFGVTRWGGYGPESPLLLAWLADLLHPRRFALPLRREMRDAYHALLGYEATDPDLDRALRLGENGASAFYGAFAGPSAAPPAR